jgi:hypothetical protein
MSLFSKKGIYKVEWAYDNWLPSYTEYVKAKDMAHAWKIIARQHGISITCINIERIA